MRLPRTFTTLFRKLGSVNALIACISNPSIGMCAQAALQIDSTLFTIATLGGGFEAEAAVDAAIEATDEGPAANVVYRALNSQDVETISRGEWIVAKNPEGEWSLEEHIMGGSSKESLANDPWIATTLDRSVAEGFNEAGSKLGVGAINLDRVSSVAVEGSRAFPRVPGEAGLPCQYSVWQQEVSIYQRIPQEAIMGLVK